MWWAGTPCRLGRLVAGRRAPRPRGAAAWRGARPEVDLWILIDPAGRRDRAEPQASRPVWFGGWRDTPVYWRDHLPLEVHLSGPAIVEQMDTTIVVDPGCTVTSDRDGNLMVEVGDD